MTALDAIGALMPWTDERERFLRNRLARAQQLGAMRARGARSETARSLFWLINETAGANLTSPSSIEGLEDLRAGLLRLFLVADMFERREAPDA